MAGYVAFVLHAHLPYVRHPEYERPLEERWLHEALWESYLPLLEVFDRLASDGIRTPVTLSVSPPLVAMLRDPLLCKRFEDHMDRLAALATHLRKQNYGGESGKVVLGFYERRIAEVMATWHAVSGDVMGAFQKHAAEGRIEIMTSSATHAYLPGLLASPASIRAQLRVGLRSFEALTGVRPKGLWLPECAYDPRFSEDLAAAGVRYTILDAHGIELASPRPPSGIYAPVLASSGTAFFARDPSAARDVWSRQVGYPGDPVYREFYRDVGFDLSEPDLLGDIGPNGTRLMTGLKLHRVTGTEHEKAWYDPVIAAERTRVHAKHFIEGRAEAAARVLNQCPHPILVAPFDAELFGHWWFEGPLFIEHALRALHASSHLGGIEATSLGGYLERHPDVVVAEPAASSWGEGGFGNVWAGPEAARLWRHVHHAEDRVRHAVEHARGKGGVAGKALDQAIRELLLLESSDWAFMLRRGEVTAYANTRVRVHANRASRLASIAVSPSPTADDAAFTNAVCDRDRFLAELSGDAIRDAFDPWSG